MEYRSGKPGDFTHVETFVWQAIFPAFDHPDLNEAQRASNDDIIEGARSECYEALGNPQKKLFVAWDASRKELAGFVIIDKSPSDYPELKRLIVSRRNWGKGIATELMKLGLEWLGTEKPVKLGVIHYNERALAFFRKYGFEDTGETAGDHLIPRVLMLRENAMIPTELGKLGSTTVPVASGKQKNTPENDLFSQLESWEEPVELPMSDELFSVEGTKEDVLAPPLSVPVLNSSEEKSINSDPDFVFPVPSESEPSPVLTVAREETAEEVKATVTSPLPQPKYDIEFEVDYGSRSTAKAQVETDKRKDEAKEDDFFFEFAFGEPAPKVEDELEVLKKSELTLDQLAAAFEANEQEEESEEQALGEEVNITEQDEEVVPEIEPLGKRCWQCREDLSLAARFCSACGTNQEGELGEEEEFEDILASIPKSKPEEPEAIFAEEPESIEQEATEDHFYQEIPSLFSWNKPLLPQFRQQFQLELTDVCKRFFGERKVVAFHDLLAHSGFQAVVDTALEGLYRWVNERDTSLAANQNLATLKFKKIAGDLVEYFIVEDAASLHLGHFPQRLLRYQSADWEKVDIFRMINDYLDFENENETVFTDFITMSPRKLKNATRHFLFAGRDERIFLIVDQSLTGSLKHGFAITDSGIYWKNLLQPNHAIYFNDIERIEMKQDYLMINGHFFDLGTSLNFKVGLLLEKISRLVK